jgi:hypothetical protein
MWKKVAMVDEMGQIQTVMDDCTWFFTILKAVRFLPPYSPNLNHTEESFSAVKAWLRRHWRLVMESDGSELMLYEATGTATVTAERLGVGLLTRNTFEACIELFDRDSDK